MLIPYCSNNYTEIKVLQCSAVVCKSNHFSMRPVFSDGSSNFFILSDFTRHFGNFQSFTDWMFRKYLMKLGKYCSTFLHFSMHHTNLFSNTFKEVTEAKVNTYTERSLLLFLPLFYISDKQIFLQNPSFIFNLNCFFCTYKLLYFLYNNKYWSIKYVC